MFSSLESHNKADLVLCPLGRPLTPSTLMSHTNSHEKKKEAGNFVVGFCIRIWSGQVDRYIIYYYSRALYSMMNSHETSRAQMKPVCMYLSQ